MAKRQNFVVGSINPNTKTWTSSELNNGWDKYQVLYSGDLDGVFNAVSDYSNDSSQEIANAIQALTGAQPTGTSQNELAGALQQMREDIETSSLTFKGYVATSAPSASTYGLVEGNIWINASAMPTTFPVPASSIRVWNGASWATTTNTYTVKDFDFFRNINNGEGYYWFGGQWVVMSTDMSTTYFSLNQTSGKWEIKSSVNLPGSPTTTTPAAGTSSTRIATTAFVANSFAPLASPAFTGTPTAPTPAAGNSSTQIATTKFVADSFAPLASPALTGTPTAPTPSSVDDSTKIATTAWVRANMPSVSQIVPVGAILPYGGTTAPSGYLMCNGQAVSRTTYSVLFSKIGTAYGSGDGSTTFNLPSLTQGQTPIGMTGEYIGKSTNGVLPNITGYIAPNSNVTYGGAFYYDGNESSNGYGSHVSSHAKIGFDASRSSSIYGNGWYDGTKVIPAGSGVSYIIKY